MGTTLVSTIQQNIDFPAPGAVIASAIRRERRTRITNPVFKSSFTSAEALADLFAPSRWHKMKLINPEESSIIPCLTYLACQAMKYQADNRRGHRTGVKKAAF